MLTDRIPQPVPAAASHLVTKVSLIKIPQTYRTIFVFLLLWCSYISTASFTKKLYKPEKRTVATMLRFSIPIQYIQVVQFVPNNMNKSQNLRELSNRLTCSNMGVVVLFPTLKIICNPYSWATNITVVPTIAVHCCMNSTTVTVNVPAITQAKIKPYSHIRDGNKTHEPVVTLTMLFKTFSHISFTVQWPYSTRKLHTGTIMM
jgi:hypothetical protein